MDARIFAPKGAFPHFSSFAALEAHLDSLGLFRMTPGLERIAAVLDALELRRPPFVTVQIAGTNGKGSTAAMLAALGAAHGLRVGLYTSPHFVTMRERTRVGGAMLPEKEWTDLSNVVMAAGGAWLSWFELTTALAVLAFARNNVDLAVMETGLGGSWDAVTALEADMVVLTPFALDHRNILGPTLEHIARDKAGAIRRGAPVVSSAQRPEAWKEIEAAAREKDAPITAIGANYPLPPELEPRPGRLSAAGGPARTDSGLPPAHGGPPASPAPEESAPAPRPLTMRLIGEHQKNNARLALAAWRMLARQFFPALPSGTPLEARALAKAWHPGRMQAVPPLPTFSSSIPPLFLPCRLGWPPLLLDGAHNAHGMAALGLALAKEGIAPAAVIFSCLGDKEPEEMLPHLRALATGPIFVPPVAENPRAMPPRELAALIGVNAVPAASLREVLVLASEHMAERLPEAFAGERPQNPLLICGSLYMLGEFFALRPDCLEPPA